MNHLDLLCRPLSSSPLESHTVVGIINYGGGRAVASCVSGVCRRTRRAKSKTSENRQQSVTNSRGNSIPAVISNEVKRSVTKREIALEYAIGYIAEPQEIAPCGRNDDQFSTTTERSPASGGVTTVEKTLKMGTNCNNFAPKPLTGAAFSPHGFTSHKGCHRVNKLKQIGGHMHDRQYFGIFLTLFNDTNFDNKRQQTGFGNVFVTSSSKANPWQIL